MLRESGPYVLLFPQLLIALVTWPLVNDSASSKHIRFSTMAKISAGIFACIAYVFQWGYDGKQPSIVSLGPISRLSGNQMEDDRSSVCVLCLACIGSSQPS